MNKKVVLIVSLVVLAVIAGVFYKSNLFSKKNEAENIKLTISVPKSLPYPKPERVALNKGYFKDEGLDVQIVEFNSGKEAMNAMLASQVQLANSGETPLIFLWATDPSVNVIATMAEGYWIKLLARKDSGIITLKDLKNKRIAVTKGTTAEYGLTKFLEQGGLTINDIKYVNLQPLALPAALKNNDIDAYVAWEMHVQNGINLIGSDNSVIFGLDKSIYREYQNISAKTSWLADNGDTVNRFIKALIKAEKFINTNPDEALNITVTNTGFSKEVLEAVKNDYSVKIQLDVKNWIKQALLEQSWINSTKDPSEQIQTPDYEKLLNTQFLRAIDSSRVNE